MVRQGSTLRTAWLAGMVVLAVISSPLYAQPSGGSEPSRAGGGSKPAGTESESGGKGEPGASTSQPGSKPMIAGSSAIHEFDMWLESSREGRLLSSVRDRLLAIAKPALEAGVPMEAFMSRIREAVAKGADKELVIDALEADATRWIWIAGIIRGTSWPPSRSAAGFYIAFSAALRNGLAEAEAHGLVLWARDSRASAEKVGAAMTTAASVAMAYRAGESGLAARLGGSAGILARSRLSVGEYSAIVELASRASSGGIDGWRFMAALEATIGRGRTLAEFEKALLG